MPRPRWFVNLTDFANMVKAFIGANYLGVAYAFSQSGLALGIGGMLVIALLTDHCCHLIVKTKHHIVDSYIRASRHHGHGDKRRSRHGDSGVHYVVDKDSPDETTAIIDEGVQKDRVYPTVIDTDDAEEYMLKHMTYGDIGKHCWGNTGVGLVNFFIALTQFGFCVGYFIFIGNTLYAIFPLRYCDPLAQSHDCDVGAANRTNGSDAFLNITNRTFSNIGDVDLNIVLDQVTGTPTLFDNSSSSSTAYAPGTTTWEPWALVKQVEVTAPDLRILVASPLPVFLVMALIRTVRYMGVVSVIANFSLLVGIVAVFGYIVDGFTVSDSFVWTNGDDFFVFFGIVTGAFEGIGLVIPIESSMEGNRHLFPCFLHGSLAVLTSVLGTFGVLGYLRYGSEVEQLLNQNIPEEHPLSMAVNIAICAGILLTFPLQIFPVIQILETYLFSPGRLFGPANNKGDNYEEQSLLESTTDDGESRSAGPRPDISHIPDSVASWKRNVVRILVVLCACGLAVLLRDYFAYVIALIGSLGSSVLAFILPCLFHLKTCWRDVSVFIKVKDIAIAIFGVVASVICVVVVLQQIASGSI